MKDGTGGKYTHPDHPALSSQLYAAYARAVQARVLASVVGEEGLADTDRRYLAFGTAFEDELVSQAGRAHARAEHGRRLEAARADAAAATPSSIAACPTRRSRAHLRRNRRSRRRTTRHERRHPDPQRRPRAEGRAPRDARGLRLPRREVPAARRRDAARARALRRAAARFVAAWDDARRRAAGARSRATGSRAAGLSAGATRRRAACAAHRAR